MKGKGFAGTIKRHSFGRGPESHGSHNVRAPRLDRPVAPYPRRVFKGMRMTGHMGASASRSAASRSSDRDAERNLLLVSGSVPGADGRLVLVTGGCADGHAHRDPSWAAQGTVELATGASASSRNEALLHEAVRPSCRRAAQGTHATKTRGQVAGGARQAVAPEGHRPRPRRARPARRIWRGGGVIVRAAARATTASR